MHMKRTHPCKQWFKKKGATQTDAENMENSGDTCNNALNNTYSSTVFACRPKKGAKLLKSHQRSQGYQKTWSAQRIQTIVKHASRPLLQNTTVDCPYNSQEKLRHLWPSENVETQKLSNTEGRKITPTLTKCLPETRRRCIKTRNADLRRKKSLSVLFVSKHRKMR